MWYSSFDVSSNISSFTADFSTPSKGTVGGHILLHLFIFVLRTKDVFMHEWDSSIENFNKKLMEKLKGFHKIGFNTQICK